MPAATHSEIARTGTIRRSMSGASFLQEAIGCPKLLTDFTVTPLPQTGII
jgi:hypothetical protein